MLSSFIFFTGGLALLLFSGDVLTRASLRFAILLGVRPLTAGLTITAFATSAPEAVIGIDAAINDLTDIVLGNVIGSNIANILAVLGLSALFISLQTNIPHVRRHMMMMLGSSFILFAFAVIGEIRFLAGAGFLALIFAWLFYSFRSDGHKAAGIDQDNKDHFLDDQPLWIAAAALIFAIGGLWGGARIMLIGAEVFIRVFGFSEAVVGLTLIAIGTSLPELATSVAAIWRRHSDIAIGNILGSNIFNILFVLGIASMITPIQISKAFLMLDLPVMMASIFLLIPFIWAHHPLSRLAGMGFLTLYGFYIWSLYAIRPEML